MSILRLEDLKQSGKFLKRKPLNLRKIWKKLGRSHIIGSQYQLFSMIGPAIGT
jgi:hypothetical protein